MQPFELFNLITSSEYCTAGDSVDYSIVYDQDENIIRLMFQGSTSKRDWINDFDFPAKLYREQKNWFLVHRGFGRAWKSANDEIMKHLLDFELMIWSGFDFESDGPKIQICGHSMGGALSLLAAEDFHYRTGRTVDEVITFGSPKPVFGCISKSHFKKSAKSWKQYRFMCDGVTWCPPFIGYHNITSNVVDKKNWWKLWRLVKTPYWHMHYGDSSYYY